MNPPKNALLLGHPIIAVPVCFATFAALCAGLQDRNWCVLAFLMLWPAQAVARASMARTAYFQWKRAWDGMAEPARQKPPRSTMPARWRPWLGGLLLAAIGLLCLANANDPLDRLALVWIIVVGIIAGVVALIRRAKRPARATRKTDIVTVCVSGPLMPVPSLKNAYRAMPEHCLIVLGIPRR